MKARKAHPNAVSYTIMISGYGKVRDLAKAEAMWTEMTAAGVLASHVTWGALLRACAKARDWERALHYFERMSKEGVTCEDNLKHASVLRALSYEGKWAKCAE